MQIPVPEPIKVSMDSYGAHVRFESSDEAALVAFAEQWATRKGMRSVGALRVTKLTLNPTPDNVEADLGLPTPYALFLISHQDLAFAGEREPQSVTVFITKTPMSVPVTPDEEPALCYKSSYHFSVDLK